MQRHRIDPRPNWEAEVEKWGLVFHTHLGKPYWDESAYYTLGSRDVDAIESATNELHRLCMETVQDLIRTKRFREFDLPAYCEFVLEDYAANPTGHLYGRFDFAYDGTNPPKMLEYNADTPTSLLEAAVVQWQWSQDRFPGSDQFNSLWESLIARWTWLKDQKLVPGFVHFAHSESDEDLMTIALLRDTATEAGLQTEGLLMSEIGWNKETKQFLDARDGAIRKMFKLYPWELMVRENFGSHALQPELRNIWIEPIWKMLLANKAILPILWERYPNHPNLLPAYFDGPRDMARYVRKPLLSREGDGVRVVIDGVTTEETPDADTTQIGLQPKYIYQALAPLFEAGGNHAVIGSWVVGDESAGVGIRESDGRITTDLSRFVPHVIR